METKEQKLKNTHHGHAIKRFRHTLGIKQEALAAEMGLSQALISTYEQRKILNNDVIERFAKALNVAPELIKELEEDPVTFIIENNTFEKGNINVGYVTGNTITNNPIEQILALNPDKTVKPELQLGDETVRLTQSQMGELFDIKENTVTYHIKEIYSTEELEPGSTTRKIRVVRKEGDRIVNRNIDFYNLDMIISVGYRVSSKRGIQFRQWANKVLKGYAINQRVEQLEKTVAKHEGKINFFVRTAIGFRTP
ncbi:MAG: RhuM family protein [Proteiniphilum sp.]|nr:RhuM family protein [Proteiniphilum sp.]